MVSTDAAPSAGRPAAFFDLDKTIIARSSTLAFSRAFFDGGLITRRSALRSAYAQFVFGRSGADHQQMEKMRAYLSQLAAGWHVQTVRDIVAETLHTIVDPMVYDEAVGLIEEHRAAGRDVVIVSTSGAEVVEPIGQMLGVDHVIATQMVVEAGRYTGEIAFYAFGPNKAAAIRELAGEQGYDLALSYGYSDSETDLPLLEAVGRPHAVNPDRTLRRVAAERDWPVLHFTRPVALRRRMGIRPRPRVLLLALLVAAGVGAAAAWQVQRRRVARVTVRPDGPSSPSTRDGTTRAAPVWRETTRRGGLPPWRRQAYNRSQDNSIATRCMRVPTRRSTLRRGQSPSGNTRDDGERMHAW